MAGAVNPPKEGPVPRSGRAVVPFRGGDVRVEVRELVGAAEHEIDGRGDVVVVVLRGEFFFGRILSSPAFGRRRCSE